jgi:hypothetical protein
MSPPLASLAIRIFVSIIFSPRWSVMRRVLAAVGRVHYGGNHDLPRVRLCEPRLYDRGAPDSSSLGKDEDKANLLDEIPLAAIKIGRTLL